MGKPILWSADRVQTDENNRFVSDANITNWNNKLENITIDNWNNAINSGFYSALAGATNAPDSSVPLSGTVIASGNLIIQQLYPEDTSTEELIYYIRKGFKSNNNITWSKWFITNLYMEEVLTRIIKGYNGTKNLFNELIPDTVKSIIFTDIKMPSNATLIDVDEDGDGGVVAWVDTNDNTKMYVSTQHNGVKVEGNSKSDVAFSGKNLISIDLSNFDANKVISGNSMFSNCKNLISIDLSKYGMPNITSAISMFADCTKIDTIKLPYDTHNLSTTFNMFGGYTNLTSIDLSDFDTSNVTTMYWMFYGCTSLTALNVSNLKTGNVTNMVQMFANCKSLTSIDVSKWDTSNVTNISNMFYGCTNLATLDLSNWDTSNVTETYSIFQDCNSLTSIKVGDKFKWTCVLAALGLSTGTWKDETGKQYRSASTFPSNVAHTYTKIA